MWDLISCRGSLCAGREEKGQSNTPLEKEIRSFERQLGLQKVRYEQYRKVIKDKGWISDLSRKALEEAFESIGCLKALQNTSQPNWNQVLSDQIFDRGNVYSVKNLLYLGILLCRDVKMKYLIDIIDPFLLTNIEGDNVTEELAVIIKIAGRVIPGVAIAQSHGSSIDDRQDHINLLNSAIGPTIETIINSIGRNQTNYDREALSKSIPHFILRTFTLRKFMESTV